ncbi:MAG: hypothetical protein MRJ65_05025 [Candidatus Brocadiaceae bacterium]|nr:hypothetical protein [Candidatus Brocadiaceae bacterium]
MKLLMDADCLIKLTKSKLKELVCKNFTVTIPQLVKEEIVCNDRKHIDAVIIKENIERKLITLNTISLSSKKGEDAIFSIFQEGGYEAICSDDKRFIKRLRFLDIPYITPTVFIILLLEKGKLTTKEAQKKLDRLSSFVSDEEYNAIKAILKNWRKQ